MLRRKGAVEPGNALGLVGAPTWRRETSEGLARLILEDGEGTVARLGSWGEGGWCGRWLRDAEAPMFLLPWSVARHFHRTDTTPPLLKIFGLQRSGSNYLQWLLEQNFVATRVLVDETGWKHGPVPSRVDWSGRDWHDPGWPREQFVPFSPAVREWIEAQRLDNAVPVTDDLPVGFNNNAEPVGALACGDQVETYVLTANVGSNANSKSMVVMFDFDGARVILTGDATGTTQDAVVRGFVDEKGGDIQQPWILGACHHGATSQGSNSTSWAKATKPEMVIYNAGMNAGLLHPRCQAVDNYQPFVLDDVPSHPFECGKDGEWVDRDMTKRQYITEDNGLLRADISPDGTIFMSCSRDPNCW